MALLSQSYALNHVATYSVVDEGDDLVPDVRGTLTPAQMVDAKFFALVGNESKNHRDASCTSLHDRRLPRGLDA